MRKLLSVFTAFAMALTILTGSIALPLLIRPFYRARSSLWASPPAAA